MSVNKIADRYAKSLIDLANDNSKVAVVLDDIQGFRKMLASKDLVMMLKSPIINASKKNSVFKALFDGKFDPLTMTFFDVILKKGREEYLSEIADSFVNQYKVMSGITDVKLTTATALSEDQIGNIKSALINEKITSDKIELSVKVDSSLIGGYVIEVGDRLLDNSVVYKLAQLKKQFA